MKRAKATNHILNAMLTGAPCVPSHIPVTAQAIRAAYDLGRAAGILEQPTSMADRTRAEGILRRALRAVRRMEDRRGGLHA
jgi:hypothetical protein